MEYLGTGWEDNIKNLLGFGVELHSSGSRQGLKMGSCKHGNKFQFSNRWVT
jgi:hypothetical protein